MFAGIVEKETTLPVVRYMSLLVCVSASVFI